MKCNRERINPKRNWWLPPKGFVAFFFIESDDDFKRAHPVGYVLLVLLGMIAWFLPIGVYVFYAITAYTPNHWILLGFAGAFLIGFALFNFVAIIIRQYLGHLVSLVGFLLGGALVAISYYLM